MSNYDWTSLPCDLLASIGGLLIADDLADFIRFRAVCHPWRSSTQEMRHRVECLQPSNWIMLCNPELSPTEFYNTSMHKSFWFDLTVFLDQSSLFHSSACLMILQNRSTQGFALLNPFMRSITHLPSKIESACPEAPSKIEDLIHDPQTNRLSDVYVTSSSTIVLRFSTLDYLLWTKPGGEFWVFAEFEVSCFGNVLFYDDRIFAIDLNRGFVQINFANEMPSQLEVEVVIPNDDLWDPDDAQYLTNCGGNIILLKFTYGCIYDGGSFEMYKLDLKEKKRIHIRNLGNQSIFLGENRTFSISCENLHLISANCIYFCKLYYYDGIASYNLSTNHLIHWPKKSSLRPSSLVEKLIKYCLRSRCDSLAARPGRLYN